MKPWKQLQNWGAQARGGAISRRMAHLLGLALALVLVLGAVPNTAVVHGATTDRRATAQDAPPLFRETRSVGVRTVTANEFRWLDNGLLQATGVVSLGAGLPSATINAATLSSGGAVRALVLDANGVSLHLDAIRAEGDALVAHHVVVVPPVSWGSRTLSSDTPVAIGRNGSGASIALPDIAVANGAARVTGLRATLHLTRHVASLSLDAARLLVQQPDGAAEMPLRGRLASDGTFSGYVPRITLEAAGAQLAMRGVLVSSGGLRAAETRLRLPASLGGWESAPIANLTLTDHGLGFGGSERVVFPGAHIGMGAANGYQLRSITATLVPASSGAYLVQLDGAATIAIRGASAATEGRIVLRPNGVTTAQIAAFSLPIAGLNLLIPASVADEDGLVRLPTASLQAPEAVGGFTVEINNITFNPATQEVTIGGGSFKLPPLKFSGITLGLEGSLAKEASGYEIAAKGTFDMSGLGKPPVGCAGIEIEGRIFARASQNQRMVISLARPHEQLDLANDILEYGHNEKLFRAITGVALRQAALKLTGCKIPIPSTTFSVSSVSGEIALTNDDAFVKIGMGIENDIALPSVGSVLAASGEFEVRWRPVYRLALEASVKVFSLQLAQAKMAIEYNPATSIPRFSAGIYLENVVMRGEAEVNAWAVPKTGACSEGACETANTEYYFTIRGKLTLGFKKNSWGFLGLPWKDFDVASAEVQGGRFRNKAWGFRADAKFLRWRVGIYVDTKNKLVVNPGDNFRLADPPRVAQARANWAATLAQGATSAQPAALAPFSFTPQGDVVRVVDTITRTSELNFGMAHNGVQPGLLKLIMPNGNEVTADNAAQYSDVLTYTSDTEADPGTIYEIFEVYKAVPGEVWKVKFDDSQATTYTLDVFQQPEPAVASDPSAKDTDGQGRFHNARGADDESAELRLKLDITAPVSVTVYLANEAEFGQDVTPQTIQDEIEQNAIELATLPGPEADGEMVIPVDLSQFPSGNYRALFRIDDGYNAIQEVSAPETLHVDHGDAWPTTWTLENTDNTTYDRTTIEWQPFANPDADNYNVYIADQPGAANPIDATLVD